MELSCAGHLKAWILEEVESRLAEQNQRTLDWSADLLTGLLSELSIEGIFLTAAGILPPEGLNIFLSWSLQNYPRETQEVLAIFCVVMKQLTLNFLATKPLNNAQGFSLPQQHADTTSTKARSPRSQVRALQASVNSQITEPAVGVRVSGNPPAPDEVASATNIGGGRHICIRTTADRIKKRSLRRAMNRAGKHGAAQYRGRPLLLRQPGAELPPATRAPKPQAPRLQMIHWNCSGMSTELQLEWFAWLRQMPEIGVFVAVETHWTFSNEYKSNGWLLIHSGQEGKRGGGILLGVREDLVVPNSLKWQALIPGRLLHARCTIGKQQFDIVGLYQHAMAHVAKEQQAELMSKRRFLWKTLDGLIAGLPFRSSVLLLGDFNMVLSPLAEVAGSGIVQGSQVDWVVKEREDVMLILRTRRLVALNTWTKPTATYHHPNGSSQIDYILVRRQLAGAEARKSKPTTSPIAAWRSSGHLPLRATVKLNWQPWKHASTQHAGSNAHLPHLRQVLQDPMAHLETLQAAVRTALEKKSANPQPPRPRNVDPEIRALWRRNEQVRMAAPPPEDRQDEYAEERAIWTCWLRGIQKQKARRAMRQLARTRKREVLLETLRLANEAFQAGDIRAHYKFIRMVSPKTYRRKDLSKVG